MNLTSTADEEKLKTKAVIALAKKGRIVTQSGTKYKNTRKSAVYLGEKVFTFDSKAESKRFLYLAMLEKSGDIKKLNCQPKYNIQEGFKRNGKYHRGITYIPDFEYLEKQPNGQWIKIVEDVKGLILPGYRVKLKIFLYQHGEGLLFREVRYKNGQLKTIIEM